MKVVLSNAAEADLEDIGDHIARDNPRRALTFLRELRGVMLRLGDMPNALPLVPRYEHHSIRRRVSGSHLIFYRIEADQVFIVHILHGARDYEPLLFPES